MIPKVIHYCWFGRKPLPKMALKCISSWSKFFPDYEIKEWNEDNFDVNIIQYTKDAYESKKYAFVSDYARFWILYRYGGLYFDTDVEVIKPMDDIIERGAFMGLEALSDRANVQLAIAPGLGIGSEIENPVYKLVLDEYEELSFWGDNNQISSYSMIPMVSSLFINNGLVGGDGIETVLGINIYPSDFFDPYDSITGKLLITDNTRSIHWYTASWLSARARLLLTIKRIIRKVLWR